MDETETDDPTLVGVEAHIIAREDDGPRGDPSFPLEKRDLYSNLVLMCSTHHMLIDGNVAKFTIPVLEQIKQDHEKWVRESLSLDKVRQRDDEVYAALVDEWAARADVEGWNSWTSSIFSFGHPSMDDETLKRLQDLNGWLFRRILPGRYPRLEEALGCFRVILNDLLNYFQDHAEVLDTPSGRQLRIEKKYQKLRPFDQKEYDELLKEFNAVCYFVEDLAAELARAANLVCDLVRSEILPSYRLAEGVLTITYGPTLEGAWITRKPRYDAKADPSSIYPSLARYRDERFDRDVCFGEKSDNQSLP